MSCDAKNLAVLIKTIRRTENMSLRKFGDKVGLSHAYINKLENDIDGEKRMTLTIATLVKISKALEIPLDEFLYMCGYLDSESSVSESEKFSSENDAMDFFIHKCLEILKHTQILSSEEKNTVEKALKLGVKIIKEQEKKNKTA